MSAGKSVSAAAGELQAYALATVAAGECVNLGKAVDMVHPTAVRAGGLCRFHLHHGAMHVRRRNDASALVAEELRLLSDDLDKAAAAIDAEVGVRDYREGHGDIGALGTGCDAHFRPARDTMHHYTGLDAHADGIWCMHDGFRCRLQRDMVNNVTGYDA